MPTLAIALPCLPGGAARLKDIASELAGPRRAEFDDFHRRAGLTIERWFVQRTPDGDLVNVVLEGEPLHAIGVLATSTEPFDVWFREQVKAVHGVDFAQPLPVPAPELVFEG
jgi:hypothetical protein